MLGTIRWHRRMSSRALGIVYKQRKSYAEVTAVGDKSVPKHANIVVCGGGVIGTSVAYHLAKKGARDIVLLEQGSISCGTTWHAAGLVGQVRDTLEYTKLMLYSNQLYQQFEEKYGIGYKKCGSLSLAQNGDRLLKLKRAHELAKASGVKSHVVSRSEIGKLCPWIKTEDLVGGLWIPGDAVVSPTDVVTAFHRENRELGVKTIEGVKVNQVLTEKEKVTGVETSKGSIQCDVFVNCAGLWARELGQRSEPKVAVPLQPLEHFYLVTSPVRDMDPMMPAIRDYDGNIYAREWSGGLLSGGFEQRGLPTFLQGIPDKFEFQLLPENWDQFQDILESIQNRFPFMETAQIRQLVNGPESFSVDGNSIVGHAPDIQNYYVAAGMTSFGIASAGGIGRYLSELIMDGHTTQDLPFVDILRISPYQNGRHYIRERSKEIIGRYQMTFPGDQWVLSRGVITSALHSTLEGTGASFGEKSGFEYPLWFNESTEGMDQYNSQIGTFGKPFWFDAVGKEYAACKNGVGLLDSSVFCKIEISSTESDVTKSLHHLCCTEVPSKQGEVTVTAMLNSRGAFELAGLIIALERNRFLLLVPSAHSTKCLAWIKKNQPETEIANLCDVTHRYTTLTLIGPESMNLLKEVSDIGEMNSSNDLNCKTCDVGLASNIRVVNETFCGEQGCTLIVPSEVSLHVYRTLMEAGKDKGIRNIGHNVLQQLQTVNRYPVWPTHFGQKVSPSMACNNGLKMRKSGFIGDGSQEIHARPKKLFRLEVKNYDADRHLWIWGGEPVYFEDTCLGTLLSSGYCYSQEKLFCLMFLEEEMVQVANGHFNVCVAGENFELVVS